jgi:hypothetical protein
VLYGWPRTTRCAATGDEVCSFAEEDGASEGAGESWQTGKEVEVNFIHAAICAAPVAIRAALSIVSYS